MRIVWFGLAAVFSVGALAGTWFILPGWVPIVAIVLAGLCLVLGFYETTKGRVKQPCELSAEQVDTVRRMKAEGRTAGAIQQVLLFNRGASHEEAARLVREL